MSGDIGMNVARQTARRQRIAIVGGGYYGCHLACVIKERFGDAADVTLFERAGGLFAGSSSKHQFRLHLGYHYPRSFATRTQIRRGFSEFKARYPSFSRAFGNNVYAIGKRASILDVETYTQIMDSHVEHQPLVTDHLAAMEHARISEAELERRGFTNCSGALECREEFLFVQEPRLYFQDRLRSLGVCVRLRTKVNGLHVRAPRQPTMRGPGTEGTEGMEGMEDAEGAEGAESAKDQQHALVNIDCGADGVHEADWALNCTYQAAFPSPNLSLFYEVCVSLVYRDVRPETAVSGDVMALTVMDGPFVSLYPYVQDEREWTRAPFTRRYTLTSVTHTPQATYDDGERARQVMQQMQQRPAQWLSRVRAEFEREITQFYPRFGTHFEYESFFVSCKTKIRDATQSRECLVEQQNERIVHVLSGKINTLFEAEAQVLDLLH